MALFLVDGHALAYRAYFAFAGSPLSNSRGEETGAVYGFINTLLSLLSKFSPEHLAVVFDGTRPTFRHERYEGYKAQRPQMPDGLTRQLGLIFEAVDAMRIVRLQTDGYEADDIIATLVRRFGNVPINIVSGDKDLLQLVDERVHVIRPGKGAVLENEMDGAALQAKLGLRADQMVDFLALLGDTTDNIPGVRGIGDKTATELLLRFGTLDEIYRRLGEIEKPSVRARLEEGRDAAYQSRDLVRLHDDVPVEVELEELVRRDHRTESFAEILQRLEFKRMHEQLFGAGAPPPVPEPEKPRAPAPPEIPIRYRGITAVQALAELAHRLVGADEIAVDVETSSLDPMRATLAGIAVALVPGESFYIPVVSEIAEDTEGALPGLLAPARAPGLPLETVRAHLAPVFASEQPAKIGQNIKFDSIVLARAGLPLRGIRFDTMLASYSLDPARKSHGLDALALDWCHHRMIPFEALFDKRDRAKDIRRVALDRVVEYAAEDADFTLRVKHCLAPLLAASEARRLFYEIEMPLSNVLTEMEMTGVKVDVGFLAELARGYGERIGALEERIFQAVGERFNPASTPKLREILFERLGLKPAHRTKTGFSTDADVLESLSGSHPVVTMLLEWRQLVKLKSTYVDALPRLVHPETGRVHTSYNQAIATTGRLSSSEPNLQNIPIRTAEGREIRRAFVAHNREWVLIDADYSQIELRILAHLSDDDALLQAFREDADIHRATAARVMKVDPKDVTAQMRDRAKVVNFGIVYGMGARGLAQSLDIEVDEARRFIDGYFRSYPGVKRFIDTTVARARRDKAVSTMFGRSRRLPDIDSTSPGLRAFSERVAVNTPVQGTAADIIKLAMLKVHRALREAGMQTRMILQVHDELLFEAPVDELERATAMVRDAMESAITLKVPLKVEVGTGPSWLEAH
ncbi:MAG TPA: DNA polymerase I [Candidatus Krumholzibacteria bacterium]|nr:DNA polymerase I [Candidatus Krumholzibacteria bacterium]